MTTDAREATEKYADFQQQSDDLINRIAESIDHEPCQYTLKASSGLILDHLLTLVETAESFDRFSIWSKEIGRCNGETE